MARPASCREGGSEGGREGGGERGVGMRMSWVYRQRVSPKEEGGEGGINRASVSRSHARRLLRFCPGLGVSRPLRTGCGREGGREGRREGGGREG